MTTADSVPLDEPLEFETYLRPQVWGGDALGRLLGKRGSGSEPIGEAWEVCGLSQHPSVVVGGMLAGQSLPELWRLHSATMTGTNRTSAAATFPLFVKWLDCRELLSVQVHPDDALARELLGETSGKTEAWVVISAEPTARVYAGLRAGVSRDEFLARLKDGTVAECLHSFTPRVGDCISLPAGTVHAAGGGVVFAEVQQPSDATFRLFDWNRLGLDGRPRTLHHERALHCISWPQLPVSPVAPQPLPVEAGNEGELLLKTSVFELERYTVRDEYQHPHSAELSIWMVLDGGAMLTTSAASPRVLKRGSTVLLPAGVSNATWAAEEVKVPCRLLCIRLPAAAIDASHGRN